MILGLFLSAVLLGLTRSSSELYGKYLTGFTFASFDKMGKQMCVRECQSYPGRCKSVNYNRVHLSCDLNTDSATDKPEAILDREGSTHITISILAQQKLKLILNREELLDQTDLVIIVEDDYPRGRISNAGEIAKKINNNSVCGDLQCSTQEKCVVKKSRPSCVFIGCDLPRIKNAEDNGGILMYRKTLQCKTGYRALASLMCSERGLDKNATEFRCYKEVDQRILIYRGQSGGTDSDYLSFISNGTSDETNKNVNDEYCTSITKSPLCTTNYRTSLIDRWQSLGISQVQVALYKNGTKVVDLVFNGTGTNQESWFSPSQILSSSWSDVLSNQTYRYFDLEGHVTPGQWRNFQIWKSYGGCPNDIFWMSSSYAEPGKACPQEQTSTKQYIYCPNTTHCNFEQEYEIADVMTVSIKMSE